MTQVAILGAGFAGLSSGWLLKQHGLDFTIYEKRSYPGGLARSFEWNGFHCDFAAHRLFTTDENVLQELLKLVPMGRHIRRSKIYLRGHWLRDPLDVLELGTKLSAKEKLKVLQTYLFRPKNAPEDSFENYVLKRYGQGLYDYFFKPYTEKLFGIPGDEISVLWARQKVRLANPLDSLRENTKTKFQYFYYPIQNGYGAIADRLFEEIQDHVHLNTTIKNLALDNDQIKSVQYEKNGKTFYEPVDTVISTLPLTLTGKMLGHTLPLKFQKVDSVYLLINRPFLSDNHWIYFMDEDVAINRMVEFKNMSPIDTPDQTSVVCAEVTQEHADVIQKVVDDLIRVGLVQRSEIIDTKVIREEFSYPVYNSAYADLLQEAEEKISQYNNLFTVGRAAEFKHREVDDNFAAASEAITKIATQFAFTEKKDIHMETKPTLIEEKTSPLVTAVVLAWNNYDDTHECLETILASNYSNLEIILVDNGSEDNTPERVRKNFSDVTVIENGRNIGVPAGYNVGFSHALKTNTEYILMLNNDVALHPDMVTELIDVAESQPETGIVMPKVLYYGKEDEVWSSGGKYRAFPPAILMTDKNVEAANTMRMIEYAPSCGLLIHRRAFERAGLFDPGFLFLFDDWDFSERVRAHGLKIWYTPNAYMWHKVSRSTKGPTSPLFWRTTASSTVRYYRRHGRPVWLSVPIHVGYIIARDIIWKRNWAYWPNFWEGLKEGLQKPLGPYPTFE
jgi:protoporphyrinogen oxidase/GT2 family glycosyltransferase